MIEDLRRLESGTELVTDLCVIGSGAAGIAIAREFFGAGTQVLENRELLRYREDQIGTA